MGEGGVKEWLLKRKKNPEEFGGEKGVGKTIIVRIACKGEKKETFLGRGRESS